MSGKRLINRALKNIAEQQHIEAESARREYEARGSQGPNYAAGLQSESYVGGYRQALNDVLLAMQGITPSTRGWWDDRKERK